MRLIRIFLVHLAPATRAVARAAATLAFPNAEVVELRTVAEAEQWKPRRPRELLVLAEPSPESTAQAVQTEGASEVPRWAVVLLGGEGGDLAETVPPEEWQPALLARVFRSALLQHELWAENIRLQGDLRTVARRIRHDLGAPIGCIHASAHVVKLNLSAVAQRSVAAMLQNIEDSSAEISQIVERVSVVLRASADPAPPGRCEVAGVIAGVLRELQPEIDRAGARVTLPEQWPVVTGVAAWLEVIWGDLLQNAVRHGGPSPQIELRWDEGREGWRFEVRDRGPEADPVVQAGFFRAFDQLHLQPAPGLGLAIVRRLVELQGGRCGYERASEGASVFYFTLPGPAAGGQAVPAGPEKAGGHGASDVEAVRGRG